MAKDTIITSGSNDDKYYVDANGAKVTNTWVNRCRVKVITSVGIRKTSLPSGIILIPMERQSGQTAVQKFIPDLDGDGNATGTFAFDEDGHMLSGWQDVELSSGSTVTYYFGDENDEGWLATGWQYLEMPDTSEDDSEYERKRTRHGFILEPMAVP